MNYKVNRKLDTAALHSDLVTLGVSAKCRDEWDGLFHVESQCSYYHITDEDIEHIALYIFHRMGLMEGQDQSIDLLWIMNRVALHVRTEYISS